MKGYDIPLMIGLAMLQMVLGLFVMIFYSFVAITFDDKSMEAWWPVFGFLICMFALYIGVYFVIPDEGQGHILGRYLYFAGLFVLLSLVSFDMVWWLFVNASSVVTLTLLAATVCLMGYGVFRIVLVVSFEERDPALLYRIARTPGLENRLLRFIIANILLMFLFAMLSIAWPSRALAALMVACLFLFLAGGAVYKPLVWMSDHRED